jgi:myo-inositol-1(or 4)-monophosphatase
MTDSTPNPNTLLKAAAVIARSAGELLKEAYYQPREIDTKSSTIDLVTQADRASEAMILSALKERFPDHNILAEESSPTTAGAGLTWIIDPLDGTTNFAHGFPVFAVSIALWDEQGPLLGVVYDPLREECFAAIRGQGATLNDEPIHVSGVKNLNEALLATGFPYDRHTAEDNNVASFGAFIRKAQGVRRAGSAALDQCYVACGRLDGFWEMRLHAWDVAAGILIVREAGGKVTDYQGNEKSEPLQRGEQIVASNGLIHSNMLETLRDVYTSLQGKK